MSDAEEFFSSVSVEAVVIMYSYQYSDIMFQTQTLMRLVVLSLI